VENRQHELMRQQMIAEVVADAVFLTPQIGKSAFDSRVIDVMGRIPRHEFVPVELQAYSYINSPLPVGYGKTVSQPFIIALMTDLLEPQIGDIVLEVGAGVGYQAAILSELVKQVYSIEIIEELALDTRRRLGRLGYRNIEIGVGQKTDAWAGAEFWADAEDETVTLDHILDVCDAVVIGQDGGGLDDLYGFSVLGRERETRRWLSWCHAWCHEGVLERRQSIASRLLDFKAAGELTIVAIAGDDIAAMIELIDDIKRRGLLAAVAVDPAGLGEMVEALAEIDITVDNKLLVGAPQGFGMMNAIKTAERKTQNKTLIHARSALMDWCVGNVKIEPTATAIKATKQNAGDAKIDPWMALMNAIFMMTRNPEAQASSGWNTDDIDGLMAKIDAAAEAMADLRDPERGTKVLHGIGRPA